MALTSEEGKAAGLGWVAADVVKLDTGSTRLKVPHMGWNLVERKRPCVLYDDMYADPRFYFVHSYHVRCHEVDTVVTTTQYGFDFVSSFQKENIFGVQFHPEKSHKFGMKLLRNFCEMTSNA
jgi:glutamine amidotransferase